MSSNNLYGSRSNGGGHGDVFTSPEVVKFMLDMLGYTSNRDLSQIRILEPACGEGEFIVEIAKRIGISALNFGFDAKTAFAECVFGYDIDESKIQICKKRLEGLGYSDFQHIMVDDFLTCHVPQVDMVVGNPPYVRYENIPEGKRRTYKNLFLTFHYRADLYVLFFEKTLRSLSPEGKHCFICSNRWFKNEYGKKLRKLVAQHFRLNSIVNLENADAFQEAVLAYPSITLIENLFPNNFVTYADVTTITELPNVKFEERVMPNSEDWSSFFNMMSGNKELFSIEELGFKIGIGVATGADSVFISRQLPEIVEKELLLPGISSKNLRGDKLHWNGEYLLNPFSSDGKLIDLANYPKAAQYLLSKKSKLSSRHIAKKHVSKWYKTIDRIDANLLYEPKILLPDMSGNKRVFVDEGCYYPLHNIYYVIGHSIEKLKVLGAVLMSDIIHKQLCGVSNQMNGGYPRWQSQNLRKLLIPDILHIEASFEARLVNCYEQGDYETINMLVHQLYYSENSVNQVTHIPKRQERQLLLDFVS